ncbi:hypothetical protein J7L87_05095, partial [bacterium]|nr:hypothetical protein [bacterium]
METEFLLVSMAGVPNILSDFVPDNGLASLASSLLEEGTKVKILDLNRVSLFSEILSENEKTFLEKFSRKIFIEEKTPSFVDILKLKFINRRIEKNKKLYLERLKFFIDNIVKSEKVKAVGFKLWAGDGFSWSMEVGKYLKSKNPEIKIFGGGPQVDIFEHLIYKDGNFF